MPSRGCAALEHPATGRQPHNGQLVNGMTLVLALGSREEEKVNRFNGAARRSRATAQARKVVLSDARDRVHASAKLP